MPVISIDKERCLGADGAVAHVSRTLRLISGRWKLQILFRLYADQVLRSSQMLRDMQGISQKVLTQRLRKLERDGLIQRIDFSEQPSNIPLRSKGSG